MWIFLLLIAVPIIEIALFIELGGAIGLWPTIGLVILTALIGSILLRQQGLAAMRDVQARLGAGEDPGRLLADGAMILVAGALLLTPGFFTDAVGFLLLVPGVRGILWDWGRKHVHVAGSATFTHGGGRPGWEHAGGGQTVDGEFSEVDPEPQRPDPGQGRLGQ